MKKKKSSVGCLFWIALILLIIVVFLFSRSRIDSVMDATGFLNIFTNKEKTIPDVQRIDNTTVDKNIPANTDKTITIEPEKKVIPEIIIETPVIKEKESILNQKAAEKNMRTSTLYFVNVSDENKIALQGISRPVYYDDSPLTETLTALISGLTSSELNKGLLSLIPLGTKIESVNVSNMTAIINFNETLSFNNFGKEGLEAELKQIIYTATEFSTVDKVQILIDGKKKQYLSTEGVYIGEPLSRASVQ